MKKSLVFALVVWGNMLSTPFETIARQAGREKLPLVRPARIRHIDVKHIALDLRFDWQKKQTHGRASITVSPLTPSDHIPLDAAMFTIQSITSGAGTELTFQYDGSDRNDNLVIQLDRVYQPAEEVTVHIHYHTRHINESDPNSLGFSFGKGVRFFSPTFTDPRKRKQIWSVGMPESNRYWFPGYDSPDDFRTTELRATVDQNLTVVSNGVLVSARGNGDGTKTFHWKMEQPYANHQTSLVVGEYVDLQETYAGIDIHNFSYPDEVEAVKASTVRLTDMIKFFSEKIGTPYPYPTYKQVFVQEFPWGGGHNMNTSTLSDNMIDDEGTHADFLYLWDGVEGNDLAAQWFGNLLTPQRWEHAWLSRSFATYFSSLYNEYKNGVDEVQWWVRPFYQNVYRADVAAGIQRPLVTNQDVSPLTLTGDNYALYHGAEVLHMLRKQLGEERWWKSIARYVKTHAHQTVTTDDFAAAIQTATGEDMGWFFDQWVYGIGHPVFVVTKKYDATAKKLMLSIKQTQTKNPGSPFQQVDYFKGWMDIGIDARTERVWLQAREENVFSFLCAAEPALVNVDVGNAWIKELTFEKTPDELVYQLLHDRDITGRRAAMLALGRIAGNESATDNEKQKIIDAFHAVAAGNGYWRLRGAALGQLSAILQPPYDAATLTMVTSIIQTERSWLKAWAIGFLGSTHDAQYAPLYRACLDDKSDRVISAAALALAHTRAPHTFETLYTLKDKPSWKNQSLLAALNAMQVLGDPRAVAVALDALKDTPAKPRWTLANNSWDYRVVAAETLAAFGKGSAGFPIVQERFKRSMEEHDINDIFNNVMLAAILGDPRGLELIQQVKTKFQADAGAMLAVEQYEAQLKEAIKGN